jgi:hypothetical protein
MEDEIQRDSQAEYPKEFIHYFEVFLFLYGYSRFDLGPHGDPIQTLSMN